MIILLDRNFSHRDVRFSLQSIFRYIIKPEVNFFKLKEAAGWKCLKLNPDQKIGGNLF